LGGGEQVGKGAITVGLMMGAVGFGLQVEEQTLGEVFFVFDDGDEGGGGWIGHRHGSIFIVCLEQITENT
jgi:hypothetical protein